MAEIRPTDMFWHWLQCVAGAGLLGLLLAAAVRGDESVELQWMELADGTRFAMVEPKPVAPAPTLLMLALAADETLLNDRYSNVGRRLAAHGFVTVALDLPCHGADVRSGEPSSLLGWRYRLAAGDTLMSTFAQRASRVVDHLIEHGYTDPERIGVCGTSRGGFAAFHVAAADARVRCVAGFSPVTDLGRLAEFADVGPPAGTEPLTLLPLAEKLVDRATWICIGNDDPRVGTDAAIEFYQALVAAHAHTSRPAPAHLHVMPSQGHATPASAHELAAHWFLAELGARN